MPDLLTGAYGQRHRRAGQLLADRTHAREMLQCYLELVGLQAPLYQRAVEADWIIAARTPVADTTPALQLERFPLQEVLGDFRTFLGDVIPIATDTLAGAARALQSLDEERHAEISRRFLAQGDLSSLAAAVGCKAPQLEFLPRAFFQPIVEGLAERCGGSVDDRREPSCPLCGRPPQVSLIRDEPEVKGRRFLICSLCATPWPFRRSVCPACGETDPERLAYHTSEETPHVRVDECTTCRVYVKSVDLRIYGGAVPIVEDIATAELDLWAAERGLRKIQANLLGL